MKRNGILKSLFVSSLTVIVLFTVSVRETHYLFAEHHSVNEHCDNHLHSQDAHSHCSVCKFDVSLFTDEVFAPLCSSLVFDEARLFDNCQPFNLQSSILKLSLRGPPVLA